MHINSYIKAHQIQALPESLIEPRMLPPSSFIGNSIPIFEGQNQERTISVALYPDGSFVAVESKRRIIGKIDEDCPALG